MLNENDAPCIKEQEPNATNVRNHTTNTTPKEFKNKGSPHDPNNHNRSTIRNQNKLKKHGIPYVKEQESTAIHVQNCTTNTMPKKFKDKDNPYDVNNNNPSTIHKQNKLEKNDITFVNAAHVQNRQPRHPNKPNENRLEYRKTAPYFLRRWHSHIASFLFCSYIWSNDKLLYS